MTITLDSVTFLASPAGEHLLEHLAQEDLSEMNMLRLLTALRKDYTAERAGAAVEMARLRVKAVEKFGEDAHRMLFTGEALEQASNPLVRRYRAAVIGVRSIVDACCGIGADSLSFASAGADVVGLDIDPARVAIARHNAASLGLNARFEVADVCDGLPEANAVFFDPARRDEQGKRIYHVEEYIPPLSTVRSWKQGVIVAKLSPGVDLAEIGDYGGEVEFISVNGDLKEAVLWLGEGRQGKRATLLIADRCYTWPDEGEAALRPYNPDVPLSEPRAWLVEPNPAILRAGLVQDVAAKFDGHLLDETIAYFTTDDRPDSPWVRAWQILDWMPFNLKKLRTYLRERNVGKVTVKKRGSPITPEGLIAQLKLKGDQSRTLVLTRCQGQAIVIICEANPG